MQSILQQAKGDPAALQDHMKNPEIRSKVSMKLSVTVIRKANRGSPNRFRNWWRLGLSGPVEPAE